MKRKTPLGNLVASVTAAGILLYVMWKTTSPKIILLPFLLCALAMAGKSVAQILGKDRLAAVFHKLFVAGFLLFWFEIELPAVAGSVLSMFASMNTPLAMLIIGTYFAQTKVKEFFEHKSLYLVCLLRLIVLPVITVFMLYPLHLPYELYAAIVITTSAPTAAATTMFAAKFGADTKIASQSVTLCTLFSIITMPLFAALVSLLCA